MRAVWKGAVSFGLVNIPVRLMSATENHDIQFRQVRREDGSRIKYKRVAASDGEEVAYSDIAKGYETADGKIVVLTDEDLAALPSRSSKEITVEKFVPREQIDPMLYEKAYYLEPDAAGAKPYALLRGALRDTDKVALVTVSVRTRMSLALLRVVDDVLVLQTLMWPDEVRSPEEIKNLDGAPEPKANELAMAHMLVESMSGDFDPAEFEDDYQAAVAKLVEEKLSGEVLEAPAAPEAESGQVVDLLAALQRSVEKAKAARASSGGDEGPDDAEPEKAVEPAKKAAKKAS